MPFPILDQVPKRRRCHSRLGNNVQPPVICCFDLMAAYLFPKVTRIPRPIIRMGREVDAYISITIEVHPPGLTRVAQYMAELPGFYPQSLEKFPVLIPCHIRDDCKSHFLRPLFARKRA